MSVNRFPPNSRYHDLVIVERLDERGEKVPFLSRRFIPPASAFDTIDEYSVQQGERLDQIAAQEIGDPLLAWRIADANDAIRPEELTETPGRKLRITLAAGFPGARNG
jgi:hypothetical protein